MIPQDPGATVSAIVGIVLAVLLVNAALVLYTWLRTPVAAQCGSDPAPRSGSAGTTVACPDCGAENDPEYRYCRGCVSELPGATARRSGLASPLGRISR